MSYLKTPSRVGSGYGSGVFFIVLAVAIVAIALAISPLALEGQMFAWWGALALGSMAMLVGRGPSSTIGSQIIAGLLLGIAAYGMYPVSLETLTVPLAVIISGAPLLGRYNGSVSRRRLTIGVSILWILGQAGLLAFAGTGSAIAYGLLFGSCVAGFVIAAVMEGLSRPLTTDLTPQKLVDEVDAALENRSLHRARALLDQAEAASIDSALIRERRYQAWKFDPTANAFHQAADALLRTVDERDVIRHYKDYLAVTQVRPDLPQKTHLTVARIAAEQGDPDLGASVTTRYMQEKFVTPGLLEAMEAIAVEYHRQGKDSRAQKTAVAIMSLAPDSPEAGAVASLLPAQP